MAKIQNWKMLKKAANALITRNGLNKTYVDRLNFEIKEIEKQGANRYWVDLFNSKEKFDHNNNGLVLPFLLGMTKVDPVISEWSYFVCENGSERTEIVELTLEDSSVIAIPANSMVITKTGPIMACDLKLDDEF